MKEYFMDPRIKKYLEKQFMIEGIKYEVLSRNIVLANCNEDIFRELVLAAHADKRTEETGLVYLTRHQIEKPGFSVKRALAEHNRHGFVMLDEPPRI